jgi:hypothetical protein
VKMDAWVEVWGSIMPNMFFSDLVFLVFRFRLRTYYKQKRSAAHLAAEGYCPAWQGGLFFYAPGMWCLHPQVEAYIWRCRHGRTNHSPLSF